MAWWRGLLSFDDLESGPHGVTPGSPLFDNPSKKSFAPRLGLSWVLGRDRRTVVRAGYGLFYQPLTVSFYRGTIFRIYPYFAGVDIRQPAVFGPGIQDVLNDGADAQRRSEFIAYDAQQPFIQHWHASAERDLGAGFTAEIGYLGSNGRHLPFYGDPNAVPSEQLPDGSKRVIPGASLRYPSWGRIRTRINVARSDGHALILGLRRRFTGGLAVQGAYTYAHSNDTWSGGQMGTSDFDNGAGSATDWWDPEAEYGPSNFDVRHTFIANATYDLPWGRSLEGAAGALARGWSVSGLAQLASGLPFTPFIGFDQAHDLQSDADTIQKPDLAGPITYPHTRDEWFDVNAFALPRPGYLRQRQPQPARWTRPEVGRSGGDEDDHGRRHEIAAAAGSVQRLQLGEPGAAQRVGPLQRGWLVSHGRRPHHHDRHVGTPVATRREVAVLELGSEGGDYG